MLVNVPISGGRSTPTPATRSSLVQTARNSAAALTTSSAGRSVNSSSGVSDHSSSSGNSGYSSSSSGGYYDLLESIQRMNNEFNVQQVDKMNQFNAQEAQKDRDFQERMSNTAYQRAVKDLEAAGLNPVLAYMNLGGATTPTGATASGGKATSDNTLGNGLVSLMSAMIASSSAATVANIYTQNQRWMAENYPNSLVGLINNLFGNGSSRASGISDSSKANTLLNMFKNLASGEAGRVASLKLSGKYR